MFENFWFIGKFRYASYYEKMSARRPNFSFKKQRFVVFQNSFLSWKLLDTYTRVSWKFLEFALAKKVEILSKTCYLPVRKFFKFRVLLFWKSLERSTNESMYCMILWVKICEVSKKSQVGKYSVYRVKSVILKKYSDYRVKSVILKKKEKVVPSYFLQSRNPIADHMTKNYLGNRSIYTTDFIWVSSRAKTKQVWRPIAKKHINFTRK